MQFIMLFYCIPQYTKAMQKKNNCISFLLITLVLACSASNVKYFGKQKFIKQSMLSGDGSVKVSFVPLDFQALNSDSLISRGTQDRTISQERVIKELQKQKKKSFDSFGNQFINTGRPQPSKRKQLLKIESVAPTKISQKELEFNLNDNIDSVIQKRLYRQQNQKNHKNKNMMPLFELTQNYDRSPNTGNYGEERNDIKGKYNWIGGQQNMIRGNKNHLTRGSDKNKVRGNGNYVNGNGNIIHSG